MRVEKRGNFVTSKLGKDAFFFVALHERCKRVETTSLAVWNFSDADSAGSE